MGKENKASDNLSMIEDDDLNMMEESSIVEDNLIMMRFPTNSIIEGTMLKLSKKDALQIIANLAVQVALSD